MKLIYLYIDNFAPFKQTEMNFVAGYTCGFSDGMLSVHYARCLPDRFFSGENPAELFVSAIVGANGSGKTSLIRFLEAVHYFPQRVGKFVMLVEVKKKLCVYYYLGGGLLRVRSEGVSIATENIRDIFKNSDDELGMNSINKCFQTFYYSPHYSASSPVNYPSEVDESDAYFTSLSTTTLLNQSARDAKGRNVSADDIFRVAETQRALRFYREAKFSLPRPQYVLLRAQDWGLSEIVGVLGRWVSEEQSRIESIEEGVSQTRRKWSEPEFGRLKNMYRFLSTPSEDAFFVVFQTLAAQVWNHNTFREKRFKEDDFGRALYELFVAGFRDGKEEGAEGPSSLTRKRIVDFLDEHERIDVVEFDLQHCDGKITKIKNPLAEFFRRISAFPSVKKGDGVWALRASAIDNSSEVSDLVEIYSHCSCIGDFAMFEFDPMLSAGEQTLLSLYSRLWEKFEDRRGLEADYDGSDFSHFYAGNWESGWLVFLDEAEVALHPRWQRELVKNLLDTFCTSFPGFNVHFIFATHSPTLLSDIPGGNVVFLNRVIDSEGRSMTKKIDVACRNTFAANVFDLYRDSFFMDHGTMGAFAESKVNALLQKLHSIGEVDVNNAMPDGLGEDIKLASLIGDPFISRLIWRRLDVLASDDGDHKFSEEMKQIGDSYETD